MADYPADLTTSDWVDHIARLTSRDEQIAAFATFQRRVEYDAKQSIIANLSHPDPVKNELLAAAAADVSKALPSLGDYVSGVDVVPVDLAPGGQISVKP